MPWEVRSLELKVLRPLGKCVTVRAIPNPNASAISWYCGKEKCFNMTKSPFPQINSPGREWDSYLVLCK